MRPFPTDAVSAILSKAKKIVGIEENFGGQLADLVQERTGVMIERRIVKYDGRPLSQDEVVRGVRQAAKGKFARVVMVTGRTDHLAPKKKLTAKSKTRVK
jgi:2-oxoglutarate ferredoxin oxidoreductase subunit alpha